MSAPRPPGFDTLSLHAGSAPDPATGARAKRRRELEDRLLEALSPLLGVRHLDRRILRLSRWTTGWPAICKRYGKASYE